MFTAMPVVGSCSHTEEEHAMLLCAVAVLQQIDDEET